MIGRIRDLVSTSALAAALVVAAGACRGQAPRPAPSPRVVSLVPSVTETVFAMGMGDHLVGATRYCTRPEAARAVPRVGGLLDVSIEAVLAARPDVVIGSRAVLTGRLADTLSAAGVRLVPVWLETAGDIGPGILAIGEALGRPGRAAALVASVERDLAALGGGALREPPVRVLFVVGRSPLVVAGPTSFLGDLLGRMGVTNVVPAGRVPFPIWSLEEVIRSDPDVVVDGAVEAGDLASVLREAGLRVAAEGRIVRLAGDAVLRPGPGAASAALPLADAILKAAGGRQ
ncbi:MAG: ABC transporter substrate-binding protein [Deltaproteobacteria bacterium]|nr:ABC transporter substrate-binding protein [Deltaproteobacteria bacterium]